jgi:LysM repeat protein/ABC-type branched-subunit amino acid transport system substrate-binding protein
MGMRKPLRPYRIFLSAILLLLFHLNLHAQEISISSKSLEENGKYYLLHTVLEKQTLYSISKAYKVTVNDILFENPGLSEGLKAGSEIKIPVPKPGGKEKDKPKTNFDTSGKFILHTVEKKQTLYSIAKMYSTDINEIRAANADIDEENLKQGIVIRIPQREIKEVEVPKVLAPAGPAPESKEMKQVSINLMLPLFSAENDSIIGKEAFNDDDALFPKSLPAVEFMAGFKLACDSMAKAGLQIKINTIDIPSDSFACQNWFKSNTIPPADLNIGPFHAHCVQAALKTQKEKDRPWMIPLAQQAKLLIGNPTAYKFSASVTTQMDELVQFLTKENKGARFFIIHNNLSKERTLAEVIRKSYKRNAPDSIRTLIFKNEGSKGIAAKLSASAENIIIVPSNDEAFVTDLINKLNTLSADYKIKLAGLENWISYDYLDPVFRQKLSLTLPANNYLDYKNEETKRFIKLYRHNFNTEPTRFSYTGYDCGIVFLQGWMKYGQGMGSKLNQEKMNGIQSRIRFEKTGPEGGFENHGVLILRYENFELVLIN